MRIAFRMGDEGIMILAILVGAASALPAFAEEVHQFNVPAEEASVAIVDFGLQANVQILAADENVSGKTLHAVAGPLSTERGLNVLLDGTGITHRYVGDRAIAFLPVGTTVGTSVETQSDAQGTKAAGSRVARADTAAGSSPADAPGAEPSLDEVTVTATRRALNVVDVPMAMTVISSTALQAQEIKTFNDFAAIVPNLSFNYGSGSAFGGGTDDRAVAIRGIQGADTTGFYIDDLPIPVSMNPRVLDLERIEVLKGPQGSLYGARSMGGTVRMITAVPDLTKTSAVFVSQGTSIDGGGQGYEVYGTINVPLLTDTLALHVTPYTGRDGGYINREWPTTPGASTLSRQSNSAATDYSGVMASLLWRPFEALKIRPTLIYQSSNQNGLPLGDYSAENLTNIRHFDIPEGVAEHFWIGGVTAEYSLPWGTFTSASDYLRRNTGNYEDVSEFTSFAFGTPLLPSPIAQGTSSRTWNQELRFTSSWSSPLQLTAGMFYNRQSTTLDYLQNIDGFLPLFGISTTAANHAEIVSDERAVFGELTYNINSDWSATVGGRYSKDRQDFLLYAWGVAFGANTRQDAIPNVTPGSGHTRERDSVFTPKFLVKYQPNGNLDIYADAAKGFRPGSGQVPPPISLCADQYTQYGLTPDELTSYKPDSVWSYEIGAKTRSADHRFAVNPSLFWIQWSDIRESLPFACGFAALINSASARSRGAELEVSAIPIEHVTLNGAIGYTDAKILSSGSLVPYPTPGSKIQQVAPLTGSFSAQYDRALGADWRFLLRGDYSYTDNSYSNTTSAAVPLLRPAYSLINLRTALDYKSMEYALFVKNVGDAHPNLGEQFSIGGFVPGRLRWTTGVPRTYGVEFSWRY
jgi:iron complex outermembrane receptor protein